MELGVCHPPSTCMLSEPHRFEIIMETSSHRHDQLSVPLLAHLPSQENGGWG